ncbi:uncharacterized protein TRIVIDRAFT_222871 [Trichoderma virens Gv29-8]|uniref:Uncharacterized protein n=1 Tax=Hypocrea virens (strain Gv29-8 / FGSC 10586) TaxID=413071 RepID=G9MVB2_HYPVG|nr:uncharacterized protein TRIVIDRAFT_222871 [Trichoderma virens Gv29-8]EHK21629.1 hypothetical protein TRIVIDRAFT_222871 [Trichoderma virens Gv29-8]UKZ51069.1 hypothetical protein TrVGV298_004824 [Trichoderma virens]
MPFKTVKMLGNAFEMMDLLIPLFSGDGSGLLRPEKATKQGRTFDEDNVFSTYSFLIRRLYLPNNPHWNRGNMDAMLHTPMLFTMKYTIQQYLLGAHIADHPKLQMYCNEAEYMSEYNDRGTRYIDDYPQAANRKLPKIRKWRYTNRLNAKAYQGIYFVSRAVGSHSTRTGHIWVGVTDICEEYRGQTHRNIGSLVIPTSDIYAYVENPSRENLDETLTFCPSRSDQWITAESNSVMDGLEFRRLHVPTNSQPNEYQKAALDKLIYQKSDIGWLGQFLVTTLIHELSHAEAFTPKGIQQKDIECLASGEPVITSGSIECLYNVAKGTDGLDPDTHTPQGHLDAEALTLFAMSLWVNSATWWKSYEARRRQKDPPPQ